MFAPAAIQLDPKAPVVSTPLLSVLPATTSITTGFSLLPHRTTSIPSGCPDSPARSSSPEPDNTGAASTTGVVFHQLHCKLQQCCLGGRGRGVTASRARGRGRGRGRGSATATSTGQLFNPELLKDGNLGKLIASLSELPPPPPPPPLPPPPHTMTVHCRQHPSVPGGQRLTASRPPCPPSTGARRACVQQAVQLPEC